MTDAIISGILLGLALVFSLGPAIFTIIKLRISYGLVSAYYFVAGVWISDFIWVFTANLFGGLLEKLMVHKLIVAVSGGSFLIGLGLFYLFFKKYHSREEIDNGIKIGAATHAKLFITGLLMNLLNPGVIALWFAAATKTIANEYTMNERILSFSICLSISMLADIFKIRLAGKLRKKLTDRNITRVNRLAGVMFILFGLILMIGIMKSKI
jgi:threonine/homoserine/homoserine lactone efflux protein